MIDVASLPNDIDALKQMFIDVVRKKDTEIDRLIELVRFFKRREFGSSSEVIDVDQLGLFNEIEVAVNEALKLIDTNRTSVESGNEPKKVKTGRKALPDNLPRERREIDLPESEKTCGGCGDRLTAFGEEISETIELIPAQMKVIETARKKYCCQNKSCDHTFKVAAAPLVAIPKSMASPSLLSYLAVNKFCDHLPFYRQSGILERFGLEISRATMASWMVRISDLLTPLTNLMQDKLLERGYLNMDETHVQVLNEPGRSATSKSYMWVYGSTEGPVGEKIILFEYEPSRSGQVATKLLEGFKGYLQVDGYGGYNNIESKDGVMRVGCMAHARRRFVRAWETVKKNPGLAATALKNITELYLIERSLKDQSIEVRYRIRQEKSKPILNAMREWLIHNIEKVPAKSSLGEAMKYALNEWQYISRYIDDGQLAIDNNFIENKIRPFALGRKNWLFSDSVDGAKASATIYSVLQTAEANGLEPWSYLTRVLAEIPHAKTADDFEKLLPLAKQN